MSIINFNLEDIKVFEDNVKLKKKVISDMQYSIFNDLINEDSIRVAFNLSDNSNDFLKRVKGIGKVFDKESLSECFYTTKIGFNFENIPSLPFYAISSLMDKFPDFETYPSYYLQSYIKEFNNLVNIDSNKGISLRDLLSAMKITSTLISKYNLRVDHNTGFSEVFVAGAGVCIVKTEALIGLNSYEELTSLSYDSKIGIMYKDKPLRLLNNIFLISNDVDWR